MNDPFVRDFIKGAGLGNIKKQI